MGKDGEMSLTIALISADLEQISAENVSANQSEISANLRSKGVR